MNRKWIYGLIFLLFLVLPMFLTPYLLTVAILVIIAMGLATSLNLIVGFNGQISFAHAAFYGIGAYSSALLSAQFDVSFWGSLLFATVFTGIIGIILGIPCLRLKGHYLAIATIGFQQIVMIVLLQWQDLTNGPSGITGIARPNLFGFKLNDLGIYYLGLALLIIILVFTLGMLRSSIGLQMIAVREDEQAAQASGVSTTRVKLTSFAVSSAMAGACGSFYAHYIGSIDPSVFNIMLSATILVMVLGGGIGTVIGPLLGGIILQILPEVLRSFSDYRMIAYGLILILIILFMPEGVVGVFRHKFADRKIKNRAGSEEIASRYS